MNREVIWCVAFRLIVFHIVVTFCRAFSMVAMAVISKKTWENISEAACPIGIKFYPLQNIAWKNLWNSVGKFAYYDSQRVPVGYNGRIFQFQNRIKMSSRWYYLGKLWTINLKKWVHLIQYDSQLPSIHLTFKQQISSPSPWDDRWKGCICNENLFSLFVVMSVKKFHKLLFRKIFQCAWWL